MKEKRILAMFIASAVTLVASLSITFGVLTTLADPVVATGIVKYAYNFGGEVNALVTEEGRSIKIKERKENKKKILLYNFEFYKDNPDLSIHEIVKTILNDCL